MALTVTSAFKQMCDNHINLNADQVNKARNSRDWLFANLNILSDRQLIPKVYAEKNIKFGSFARNTKIQPLNDIDLMLCLSGYDGHYEIVRENEEYTVNFENPPKQFRSLCEDGILNSRKVVENIKLQLASLAGYVRADVHRNQEAVTLQLLSYPWNFDIVPCFFTTTGFYLIPAGNGNWKNTDPRIDNNRTSSINAQKDGKVLQWIRIMKYWKSLYGNPWKPLSSYVFEQMLLDVAEIMDFGQCISRLIYIAFTQLSYSIAKPVYDPKGIQGDMNNIALTNRLEMITYIKEHETIAFQTTLDEIYYKNQEKAIEGWKQIFGQAFPDYG